MTEQVFKLISDFTYDWEVFRDSQGKLVYSNNAFERIFGYRNDDYLSGKIQFDDLLFKEDLPKAKELFAHILAGNSVNDIECRARREDGQEIFLSVSAQPVIIDNQRFGTRTSVRDITRRIEAQNELLCTVREWQTTFDATNDTIWILDRDQRLLRCNKTTERILQVSSEEIIGKYCWEIVHGSKQKSPNECPLLRARQSLQREFMELHLNEQWFQVTVDPILDNTGEYTGAVHILSDITARKQVEKSLQQSEAKYRTLVNTAPYGIQYSDLNGKILYSNPAHHKIQGYDDGQLIGKYIWDPVAGETSKARTKAYYMKLVQEQPAPITYCSKDKTRDGRLIDTQINWDYVRDAEGNLEGIISVISDITKQKRVEKALQENEERLRAIIQASKDAMVVIDNRGQITLFNPAAERMFGRKARDMLGESVNGLMPESYRNQHAKNVTDFFTSGKPDGVIGRTIEVSAVRADGKKFPIEISLSIGGKNDQRFVISVIRDISERKQIEHALRDSEQKFRSLIDNTCQGVYIYQDGRIVFAHKGLAKIMGYSLEELYALSPEQIFKTIHPEDRDRVMTYSRARFAGENPPTRYAIRALRKDGNILWLEHEMSLTTYDGQPAVQAFVKDITEAKAIELALAESEKNYRTVTENIPVAVWRSDAEGNTPFITKPAYGITGFTPEEIMVGGTEIWFDRIHPDDKEAVVEALHCLFEQGTPYEVQYRYQRKDGATIWLEEQAFNVFMGDGKQYAEGIFYDITARKRAEEQLTEYQGQLKSLASELTLAEERFKRDVATQIHDSVSQSLAMSRMDIGLMARGVSDQGLKGTLDKLYSTLGQTLETCRSLTSDLSYPTLNVLGLEPAVKKWAREMVEERHNIQVRVEDDGQEKPLSEDRRAVLFRGVRELLTNVIKHSQANLVDIALKRKGDRIVISVTDNGTGTPPDNTNASGFGLLSIREALERLGGEICVDKQSGPGYRVVMTAPLTKAVSEII